MRRNGTLTGPRRRALVVLCAAALVAGCDDDGGGTGGSGPGGTGGSGGADTGSGGGAAGGGGGATGEGCLDPAQHEAVLSIVDPALCAVAVYTADVALGYSASPTWGRHGGPLLAVPEAQGGGVTVVRLSPPAGPTGALTPAQITVAAGIPDTGFAGAQALDLPFFDWTALSWTGPYPDTQGELILVAGGAVAERYDVNGFFSGAALGSAQGGRLLYTGLSVLGDTAAGANALYAADSCGAAGQSPRLLPEGDPACPAPIEVAAWGDFSGPVAVDQAGNAFAVQPSFAGTQEARGFAAAAIARGAPPPTPPGGAPLFTLPGSGSSLAALAPAGDAPGLLVFQPLDPATFDPLDPVAARYAVAADAVQAEGEPAKLFTLATPATPIALMTDDQGRIWAGAPSPGGSGTTFVVIARR